MPKWVPVKQAGDEEEAEDTKPKGGKAAKAESGKKKGGEKASAGKAEAESSGGKGGKGGKKAEKADEKAGEKKAKGEKASKSGSKSEGKASGASEGKGYNTEGAKATKKGAKVTEEPSAAKASKAAKGGKKGDDGSKTTKTSGFQSWDEPKPEKGKGKGKSGKASSKGGHEPPPITVQQFEDDLMNNVIVKRPKDATTKQPMEATGVSCEVRKHSGMGCAVISTSSPAIREAIMNFVESRSGTAKMEINGVTVQLKRHKDKATRQEILTDIFAAWGHRTEKETPLGASDIADAFDKIAAQQGSQQQMPPPVQANAPLPPSQYPAAQLPPAGASFPQPMGQAPRPPMNPQQAAFMQQQQMVYEYYRQLAAQQAAAGYAYGYGGAPMQPGQAGGNAAAPPPGGQVAGAAGCSNAPPAPTAPVTAGFTKPKALPIIDPSSGSAIDVVGLNFEPRKPKNPLKIVNPDSGNEVKID